MAWDKSKDLEIKEIGKISVGAGTSTITVSVRSYAGEAWKVATLREYKDIHTGRLFVDAKPGRLLAQEAIDYGRLVMKAGEYVEEETAKPKRAVALKQPVKTEEEAEEQEAKAEEEDKKGKPKATFHGRRSANVEPKEIEAKFDGRCALCNDSVSEGDKVIYEKINGRGMVYHPSCHKASQPASVKPGRTEEKPKKSEESPKTEKKVEKQEKRKPAPWGKRKEA